MTKNKVVMLIAAGLTLAGPVALTAATPELQETRSTLKEWVEFKKLISEESSEWRVEKEILDESISLLEDEIINLKAAIEAAAADASEADKERVDLTASETALKQASAVVKDQIGDLEAMTLSLVEYLPDSLQQKLIVITQRIPKNRKAGAAASLSTRMMNVIGVLSEIEKFNGAIIVENGIENIGGVNMNVDTIYFGLAVAYYVDGPGETAGYMTPAKDGWAKTQDNSLAVAIASAIAMQEREATPEFVNLPLKVTTVD